MRGHYNVSVPALLAALAALEDTGFTGAVKRHCDLWRARVVACFSAAGRRAFDTPTNFVLAQMRSRAEAVDLCAFLARGGIGVKHLFDYDLPDCVRITIGPEPVMRTRRSISGPARSTACSATAKGSHMAAAPGDVVTGRTTHCASSATSRSRKPP